MSDRRAKRSLPSALGLSLTILRTLNGWTQSALAKASGTATSQLSQYESGKVQMTQERFAELAAVMGTGGGAAEFVISMVALLRSMAGGDVAAPPDDLTPLERQAVATAVLRMLRAQGEVLYQHAVRQVQIQRVEATRREAADLWRVLAAHSAAERRVLLENGLAFQTWAMCLRLCDESLAAASHGAGEALQIAELAVGAAQRAREDAGVRRRLQGYARAFVANAHRLAGNLPAAEAGFAEATRLWDAGDPPGEFNLAHWRLLDLQASLRWAQHDWPAAAALAERARQEAPAEECGRLLIKQASALRAADQPEAALAALEAAAPQVAGQPEALWLVHYNQISCLCQLGRYQQAAQRLPEVAAKGGDTLAVVRPLWLKARVAAGRGERQRGIGLLEQVRAELMLCGDGHEAALVAVELSILYLEQGLRAKVRELARSIFEAFQVQFVPRETWPVIVRFRGLAEADSFESGPLRRIYWDLERARIPLEAELAARPAAARRSRSAASATGQTVVHDRGGAHASA